MTDNLRKSADLSTRHGLRTGLKVEDIKQSFLDNLLYAMGRAPAVATNNDLYTALAMTVRDRVFHQGVHTMENYAEHKRRVVAYLSAEFLPGPHLGNNLLSLGIMEQTRRALSELGYDLDVLIRQEEEPGLGNGGLGRLASCFLDSLASLEVPAIGYGIRYEFGIFDQAIHVVSKVVNNDPDVRKRLKVVYFPDYNVKNAQYIFPAADLSEQISTAGMEASGTGNMKFALNGALTIGTLDGANVEIREEVGADNFFLFGLDAEQVVKIKSQGYRPRDHYEQNAMLREVLDYMACGASDSGDAKLFQPLVENLLRYDPFLLLTDYQPYIDSQDQVSVLWCNPTAWARKSILSVARMGKFSSDRSIREYCERIWNVIPLSVEAAP